MSYSGVKNSRIVAFMMVFDLEVLMMNRFTVATDIESVMASLGFKDEDGNEIPEGCEFTLDMYADYAGPEDAIHFHEGKLILCVSENTVIHIGVNDVYKSAMVVPGMGDVFKLVPALTVPRTSDRQAVFAVQPHMIDEFNHDHGMMVEGGKHQTAQEVVVKKS